MKASSHVVRWTLGFLVASALVTGASPYFISSLRVYQWSEQIGDYVLKQGYVHRNRDEGWAVTHYGAWGVAGPTDFGSDGLAKVLIWGDSYAEALEVNDDQKLASQLNGMLGRAGSSKVRAMSVGHAFWGVADYYYHIPAYDKLFHPACHFILLAEHGLKDLCPDDESFRSRPRYEFVPRELVDPRRNGVMERLNRWRLADVSLAPWKVVRNVAQYVRDIRFRVGPCNRPSATATEVGCDAFVIQGEPNGVVGAWSYALDQLKSVTAKPIVLVLVPEVPNLKQGTVRLENPQAEWTSRLAELCKVKHVDLIDMTDTLVRDYRETGILSRGFDNGRPGIGHLNPRGQLLLAEQIRAYLDNHTPRQ